MTFIVSNELESKSPHGGWQAIRRCNSSTGIRAKNSWATLQQQLENDAGGGVLVVLHVTAPAESDRYLAPSTHQNTYSNL